jgi:hypothetical protein
MVRMSSPLPPVRERPGGYQRSSNGLAGAMIATVVLVLAFVGFRALTRDNEATQVPSVDWKISMKAGRSDGKLQVLAPSALPSGWRATSASYTPGAEPAWQLGLLTSKGKYVGVYESRATVSSLVDAHVNGDATEGKQVSIGGSSWRVYTGSKGDYALARTVENAGDSEAQLVVGTAPDSTIRDFTASLGG